jgi:hypothetical protein
MGLDGNDTLTAVGNCDLLDIGDVDDVLKISGTLYSGAGTSLSSRPSMQGYVRRRALHRPRAA